MRASVIVLFVAVLLGVGGSARICHAAPGDVTDLALTDVRSRIAALDPQLRTRAWEAVRAQVDLRRAEWSRVQGVVGVLLNASASFQGLARGDGGEATRSTQESATAIADVRLPLYAGGAIDAGIEAARARLVAAQSERLSTQRELTRAAFVAYAVALGAREQLDVARSALGRSDRLVEAAVARRESGLASEADVLRAELARARWLDEVAAREGDIAVALTIVKSALLLDEGTEIQTTDSLDVLQSLPRHGTSSRPDVEAAHAEARALVADREVARAAYFPRVELFAQGLYGNAVPTTAPVGGTSPTGVSAPTPLQLDAFQGSAVVGARLTLTLFDFFVTRDAVARAEATASAQTARAADLVRRVAAGRQEAQARETASLRRGHVLADAARKGALAVELARARYETGNATLTDVISTDLETTEIATRSVQAAVDLATAHINKIVAEGYSP